MTDSPLTFPAGYATAPTVLVPINMALIPLVAGALAKLEDEALWYSDSDYQAAYTAIVGLKAIMSQYESAPANEVLAGPTTGANGIPAWRRLIVADLPALAYSNLTGIPATFAPAAHATNHSSGGSDPVTPAAIGASATGHTHVLAYSSLSGIPSTFAPAAHASAHASGGADVLSYASLANIPASFNPTAHASRHASGGSDPVTPAAIGASATGHTHTVNWADVVGRPAQFVPLDAPIIGTGYNAVAKNTGTYTLNMNTVFAILTQATAVALRISATWATAGASLTIRPSGATNGAIALACQVANQANHVSGICSLVNTSIDLQIFTANCASLTIILQGYWV